MLLLSITFHNLSFLQITFCCANHALCTFIVCRYHFVQITPTRQCLSHANDRITMFCFEFECHFLNFSEMHARITQIRKNETYGFISFTVTRKSYFRSMSLSLHWFHSHLRQFLLLHSDSCTSSTLHTHRLMLFLLTSSTSAWPSLPPSTFIVHCPSRPHPHPHSHVHSLVNHASYVVSRAFPFIILSLLLLLVLITIRLFDVIYFSCFLILFHSFCGVHSLSIPTCHLCSDKLWCRCHVMCSSFILLWFVYCYPFVHRDTDLHVLVHCLFHPLGVWFIARFRSQVCPRYMSRWIYVHCFGLLCSLLLALFWIGVHVLVLHGFVRSDWLSNTCRSFLLCLMMWIILMLSWYYFMSDLCPVRQCTDGSQFLDVISSRHFVASFRHVLLAVHHRRSEIIFRSCSRSIILVPW